MIDETRKNSNKKQYSVEGTLQPHSGERVSSPSTESNYHGIMHRGFFPLWRKIRDWGWYKDSNTKAVFIELLLLCNHKKTDYLGHEILPGQCVTGRKKLSFDLGISEQTIRTSIRRLKSTSEITIKKCNKFSIITLNNYSKYAKSTSEITINQPATNQQLTTPKNDNNDNNNIYMSKGQRGEGEKSCLREEDVPAAKPVSPKVSLRKQQFAEAWARYPRKEGKTKAERSFLSSVKTDADHVRFLAALDTYLKYIVDAKVRSQYVKAGKNFFADWSDWVVKPVTVAKTNQSRVRYE